MIYKHTVDTAVDPMPIDEMPIDIWFTQCLSGLNGTYSTIVMNKKQDIEKWDGGLGAQYQLKYYRSTYDYWGIPLFIQFLQSTVLIGT